MTNASGLRLASDIGGTFTDTVLMHDGAVLATTKTLTTHAAPAEGALVGATRVLGEAGLHFDAVDGMVHGTTLATNALIERRGARVATVCTAGFRDILEIGYERRYSQYDINLRKPDLLVPRHRSLSVDERVSVRGEVLRPLTDAAIDAVIVQLDALEAEAVAVCLLHSYANPQHEEKLADAVQRRRPGLHVSLSSAVSPEAREFDRLCTTVANAYIQPLMSGYLHDFDRRFNEAGLGCAVLMMTAGGGMCTLDTAARFPIRLVESGPAGGALLAERIARQLQLPHALSFDMGGTTAKLCLIDGTPQRARQFEIARQARFIKGSGMPVRIPVIDMIEIGAGGGSIASIDRLGRLQLGPESAGSEPGPVAFDRGGVSPTVTDADLTLGYLDPTRFAEGRLTLNTDKARRVIADQIAPSLDLAGADAAARAAYGISRVVDENMASAARMHAVESGKHLGVRTMIVFGGNGPLHATRVARAAGVDRIVVPPDPSVGSALGFLHAPVSFEIVRSQYGLLDTLDLDTVNHLFDELIGDARTVVDAGAPGAAVDVSRIAYLRYHGQGHEIEIALPDRPLRDTDLGAVRNAFDTAYAAQYSRPVPGMQIEILNWSVTVRTRALDEASERQAATDAATHSTPNGTTTTLRCDLNDTPVEALVVNRDALTPGHRITGPALVVEPQTTTLVSADFGAEVDAFGNLVLTREAR